MIRNSNTKNSVEKAKTPRTMFINEGQKNMNLINTIAQAWTSGGVFYGQEDNTNKIVRVSFSDKEETSSFNLETGQIILYDFKKNLPNMPMEDYDLITEYHFMHELGHVIYTFPYTYSQFFRNLSEAGQRVMARIINIVEDDRIERALCKKSIHFYNIKSVVCENPYHLAMMSLEEEDFAKFTKKKRVKLDDVTNNLKTKMNDSKTELFIRLNTATKTNYKHVYMFGNEENEIFDEYINTATYEDVVDLSIKLFNMKYKGMEEEMQKMKKENEEYKEQLKKDSDAEIESKLEDLFKSLNKEVTDQSDNSEDGDGDQDGGESGDGGKDGEGKEGDGGEGEGKDGKGGTDGKNGKGKDGEDGDGKESETEEGDADEKKDEDKKDECPEETKKQIKKLKGRANTMMKAESLLKEASKRGIDIKEIIKKMIEKGLIVFSSEIGTEDLKIPSRDFGECRWIMKAMEELRAEMDKDAKSKGKPKEHTYFKNDGEEVVTFPHDFNPLFSDKTVPSQSNKDLDKNVAANRKLISAMVTEFHRHQCAIEKMKTRKIVDTGKLNTRRLSRLVAKDLRVFRSKELLQTGKKHHLFVLGDFSGSMCYLVQSVLMQMNNLITFSKKAGIGCDVFGFSSHIDNKIDDKLNKACGGVYHKDAGANLFRIESSSSHMSRINGSFAYYMNNDGMLSGGTPMSASIFSLMYLMQRIKRNDPETIISFIIITDGDSTDDYHWSGEKDFSMAYDGQKIYNKKEVGNANIALFMEVMKNRIGCNITQIYISDYFTHGLRSFGFNSESVSGYVNEYEKKKMPVAISNYENGWGKVFMGIDTMACISQKDTYVNNNEVGKVFKIIAKNIATTCHTQ